MADILNMDYINSLHPPLIARLCGGDEWPVDYIDVETGLMRVDVCGMSQMTDIGMVMFFRDSDGVEHDSDSFYLDEAAQAGEGEQ